MCRSIKVLYKDSAYVASEDIYDASRQFVRKISGMNKSSKANEAAFNKTIKEISNSSEKLLKSITTN